MSLPNDSVPNVQNPGSFVWPVSHTTSRARTQIRDLGGVELPPLLIIPVLASPYPSVTEDPVPIVEEKWAHALDHVGSITPQLNFDVVDSAMTNLGRSISLIVGMAVVEQVGLAWNLCASSGWPAKVKVGHWGRAV